jgi:hypothetical protein
MRSLDPGRCGVVSRDPLPLDEIHQAIINLTGTRRRREAPESRAGLQAALTLQAAAGFWASRYVKFMRMEGLSWEQVGEVVYPEAAPEGATSKAVAAFDRFASQPGPRAAAGFTFICRFCDQSIRDRGPGTGEHPADNEAGHKGACTRLAALVSEWERQW